MTRRLITYAVFDHKAMSTREDGQHDLIIPNADWIRDCVAELQEGEGIVLFIAAVSADEWDEYDSLAARGDGEQE